MLHKVYVVCVFLEFGGKWKMLHYFAVRFFSPLIAVGVEDKGDLLIYAVSDGNKDYTLKVTVRALFLSLPLGP